MGRNEVTREGKKEKKRESVWERGPDFTQEIVICGVKEWGFVYKVLILVTRYNPSGL